MKRYLPFMEILGGADPLSYGVFPAERNRIFEEARDSYPQDWQHSDKPRLPVYVELDGTMVAS
ncbi:MAG: hypothetical protein L6422_03900, partial [Candidatus Marinimicrobia bacterium]|nr:hypothetical protein [bacterium]MCG2715421.1 hypothetical protein [Candidatus Neomarinimicrobiota bacterium]